MLVRIATSLAGALVLIAGMPTVALACQWLPPTLADAPLSTYVFVGTVRTATQDRAYDVDVEQVFRGQVPPAVSFVPPAGRVESDCEAFLEVGATYVFATDELAGLLGVGNVWFEISGDTATGVYLEGPMRTDALLAALGELPYTAVPQSDSGAPRAPSVLIGVASLVVALVLAAGTMSAHLVTGFGGPGPANPEISERGTRRPPECWGWTKEKGARARRRPSSEA